MDYIRIKPASKSKLPLSGLSDLANILATNAKQPFLLLLNAQEVQRFVCAMDNSIVLKGEATTVTITPANSQCTQITDATSTAVFKPVPLSQSPELLPPTRPLLNSCIVVLTVASSMFINVRSCIFFDHLLSKRLTVSFQIANSTAVSIALPTIQKEMNLEPAQLQWIMAAYPLSSVSKALCRLAQKSNLQFQFNAPRGPCLHL